MLENTINKYHIKVLTAAEFIDDLIHLSKHIVNLNKNAKEIPLSDYDMLFTPQ